MTAIKASCFDEAMLRLLNDPEFIREENEWRRQWNRCYPHAAMRMLEIPGELHGMWRDHLRRAASDSETFELIARMLQESEEAKQELRRKGYGCTGMSILETVRREVPDA